MCGRFQIQPRPISPALRGLGLQPRACAWVGFAGLESPAHNTTAIRMRRRFLSSLRDLYSPMTPMPALKRRPTIAASLTGRASHTAPLKRTLNEYGGDSPHGRASVLAKSFHSLRSRTRERAAAAPVGCCFCNGGSAHGVTRRICSARAPRPCSSQTMSVTR